MPRLNVAERLRIRSLSAERLRRRALTFTLSSPLMRWRYARNATDQILIVPQELRAADPSFWTELSHGHFGLAAQIADLKGASPFRIVPPSRDWARQLHGFGWLRHLAAAEEEEATAAARQLVLEWIALRRHDPVADEPEIIGRRLISWISQAGMLLEDIEARPYASILSSMGQQISLLKATWRNARDGVPRMVSLIALVLAELAVSGHDRHLDEAQDALLVELRRQILEDGGHMSRSAAVLGDLVLDLLPLGQCFQSRGRKSPAEISDVVQRSIAFLRLMRMGDGMLARFNGVSTGSPAALATVLGYSAAEPARLIAAPDSGYARMERGRTIVIADVGKPPNLEMAAEAQAGALSFELSVGTRLLFANGGFPGPADHDWDATARATASHNALCLAETSSSRLVRHERLESMVGGLPIRGPDTVEFLVRDEENATVLEASHDGYLKRFSLLHRRRLTLSNDGKTIAGLDVLEPPKGKLRLKADLPFSIHFHLHPDCRLKERSERNTCRIVLPGGEAWTFRAEGAELHVEESLYFVDSAGPRPSLQIVLRGTTFGETKVHWTCAADGTNGIARPIGA